ncbi:mitochondrial coenzyme A diphosphatase NUDT8 [Petromyzon marinus]|uniref:Nucleoside diphosphate-linked moiety X motif 8 n=1 Tax=Petromyzon marinus TaxID=7757 RepID=A0AAJ7TU29_PETMA|nr:nucleoside diphosphate-linked moiety X motif 8 [Petromyzon marinus]
MLMRLAALGRTLRPCLSGTVFATPLPAGQIVPSSSKSSSPRSTPSSGPWHRPPFSWCPARTALSREDAELLVASCLDVPNRERCRRELARRDRGTSRQQQQQQQPPPLIPTWTPAQGNRVDAAVLVSLCRHAGEPSVLLTLRSRTMPGRHSGDVCFPGGKQEEGDRDAVATALREAREELGVDVSVDSVWGLLTPVPDVTGKMLVWPVLADLGEVDPDALNPNPDEVEEAFLVSLRHLCDPAHQGYTRFRARGGRYAYTLPLFSTGHSPHAASAAPTSSAGSAASAASAWGSHRVWGLTGVLLDQALAALLPDVYSSKVHGARFARPSGGKGQTRVTRTDQ